MRTRDELERLTVAGQPLLTDAAPLVDRDEEERILGRVLASSREPAGPRPTRLLRPALLVAGAAVAAAAIAVVSTGVLGGSNSPATRGSGRGKLALTGPTIQLAGYRFRTPAGFKRTFSSCMPVPAAGRPTTVLNGFAAAASADGGCVEAVYLIASSTLQGSVIPAGAQPVDVGAYQGYFVAQDADGRAALYVDLPKAAGDQDLVYLVLRARDVSEDQLVAVAVSGLPG